MKWTYIIQNKLKAALMLFIVIALVLVNNFQERKRSAKISLAIHAIYEDRLIAESYTVKYLQYSQQLLELGDVAEIESNAKIKLHLPILDKILTLDTAFLKTKLTKEEEIEFNKLRGLFSDAKNAILKSDFTESKIKIKEAMVVLDAISAIQVTEGTRQMKVIEKLYGSASLASNFEFAVLIIIGLMIQALIFASKTLQIKGPNNKPDLN